MQVSFFSHPNSCLDALQLHCFWLPDTRSLQVNNLTGVSVNTPAMLLVTCFTHNWVSTLIELAFRFVISVLGITCRASATPLYGHCGTLLIDFEISTRHTEITIWAMPSVGANLGWKKDIAQYSHCLRLLQIAFDFDKDILRGATEECKL